MSLDQRIPIPPLLGTDEKSIKDTFAAFQQNFNDIFEAAHQHNYRTTAPSDEEGASGDIALVNLSSTYYLYVKFPSPIFWTRVQLTQV